MRLVKALVLKQPWASMIASGKKTIETRVWKTSYRGELLIVASRKPRIPGLPSGQAVALATLADCRPMMREDEGAACCEKYDGAWSWVLENVRRLKPFPVTGQLGLFSVEVPQGVVE